MFSLVYDLCLLLFLLVRLPIILCEAIFRDKYRFRWQERVGLKAVSFSPSDKKRVWIHAVSVGETRAIIPLVSLLAECDIELVIFSTTDTGYKEAQRSLPQLSHYFLPQDFSFVMRRLIQQGAPDLLILSETGLWYNLLRFASQKGAKVFLVNAKISERSFRRFAQVPFFTKQLFSYIDHIYAQNALYQQRFLDLLLTPTKISITGNTKFDIQTPQMTIKEREEWRKRLGLLSNHQLVVLGSTHPKEESLLLHQLTPLLLQRDIKCCIVPRHIDRVHALRKQLESDGYLVDLYTSPQRRERAILLMDAMGVLRICYQLACLAIVGGSFVPDIGGHNIIEPLQCGAPVLFGPYMDMQKEMVDLVLGYHAGIQVEGEHLLERVEKALEPTTLERLKENGIRLSLSERGASLTTFMSLKKYMGLEGVSFEKEKKWPQRLGENPVL